MYKNQPLRKENEFYVAHGLFIPQGQSGFISSEYTQCMFCERRYRNEYWVPSKLMKHLQNKHSEHQNKSDFFLWELQQKYCFQIKSVLIKSLTKHDSARLLSWDNYG